MARWNNPGIPHKGWNLVGCVDLGEDTYGDNEILWGNIIHPIIWRLR